MISFETVSIGDGWLLSCRRCSAQGAAGVPLPAAEVAAKLADVAAGWESAPGPNVCFVGMEPFLHPGLPQVIDAAVRLGFERIQIRTDGGALAQSRNAQGVLSAGVRHLEIVLLGVGPTHDALADRAGLFDAAVAGAQAFTAAAHSASVQAAVSVRVIACRHNAEHLPETLAAAASLGAISAVIDATALKPTAENERFIFSALESATVNRVAASVIGWSRPLDAPFDRAPWLVSEGPR